MNILLLLTLICAVCTAQKAGFEHLHEACKQDKETFCSSATDLRICMHDNWESLSQGCRTAIEEILHPEEPKIERTRTLCNEDTEKLCPSSISVQQIGQCLHLHFTELSSQCRSALKELRESFEGMRNVCEACHEDKQSLCPSAEARKEIEECIHKNWEALSQGCRSAISALHTHTRKPVDEPVPKQEVAVTKPVEATEPKGLEQLHVACVEDKMKFCPTAHTQEKIRQCITKNWENLSDVCKTEIEQFTKQFHDDEDCPMKPCFGDIHSLCASETTREGVKKCIKANWDNLSKDCRVAIKKLAEQHDEEKDTQESTDQDLSTKIETMNSIGTHETSVHIGYLNEKVRDHTDWKQLLVQLWWAYPIGLVLLIQLLACCRIRQIRKLEQ